MNRDKSEIHTTQHHYPHHIKVGLNMLIRRTQNVLHSKRF